MNDEILAISTSCELPLKKLGESVLMRSDDNLTLPSKTSRQVGEAKNVNVIKRL